MMQGSGQGFNQQFHARVSLLAAADARVPALRARAVRQQYVSTLTQTSRRLTLEPRVQTP